MNKNILLALFIILFSTICFASSYDENGMMLLEIGPQEKICDSTSEGSDKFLCFWNSNHQNLDNLVCGEDNPFTPNEIIGPITVPLYIDEQKAKILTDPVLTIMAHDIDSGESEDGFEPTTGCTENQDPLESDLVKFNGHEEDAEGRKMFLKGKPNEWYETSFTIKKEWIYGKFGDIPGNNQIIIEPKGNPCWCFEIDWIKISFKSAKTDISTVTHDGFYHNEEGEYVELTYPYYWDPSPNTFDPVWSEPPDKIDPLDHDYAKYTYTFDSDVDNVIVTELENAHEVVKETTFLEPEMVSAGTYDYYMDMEKLDWANYLIKVETKKEFRNYETFPSEGTLILEEIISEKGPIFTVKREKFAQISVYGIYNSRSDKPLKDLSGIVSDRNLIDKLESIPEYLDDRIPGLSEVELLARLTDSEEPDISLLYRDVGYIWDDVYKRWDHLIKINYLGIIYEWDQFEHQYVKMSDQDVADDWNKNWIQDTFAFKKYYVKAEVEGKQKPIDATLLFFHPVDIWYSSHYEQDRFIFRGRQIPRIPLLQDIDFKKFEIADDFLKISKDELTADNLNDRFSQYYLKYRYQDVMGGFDYHVWEPKKGEPNAQHGGNSLVPDPDGIILDVVEDYGKDTDNNGLYNYLSIKVLVDITIPGKITLDGKLYDENNDTYLKASNTSTLPIGLHYITLNFKGKNINGFETNVAYDVVELILWYGDKVDYFEVDRVYNYTDSIYRTSSYDYTLFEPAQARIIGNVVKEEVDIDGNLLIDLINISLDLNILESGYYILVGSLTNSSDNKLENTVVFGVDINNFSTGTPTTEFSFDAAYMRKKGIEGPYHLNLWLFNSQGDLIGFKNNIMDFTCQIDDFDYLTASFAGDYLEQGIDINSDTYFDYLRIQPKVNVTKPGNYTIESYLKYNGTKILFLKDSLLLNPGITNWDLDFDGKEIRKHNIDTNYSVNLYLYDEDKLLSKNYLITNHYNFNEFQPLMVEFDGNYVDYGLDIDYNGKYDYLVIEAGIDVDQNTNCTLIGYLYDSDNAFVEAHSNEMSLTPSNGSVEFRFNGRTIHATQKNNPYTLKQVVINCNGTEIDFDNTPYETQSYDYTEFDEQYAVTNGYFIESTLDTNLDSYFDYLAIDVGIDATIEGSYRIHASLVGNDSIIVDTTNIENLAEGDNTITLLFRGDKIYESSYQGSLDLNLYIYLENDHLVGSESSIYTTSSYDYSEFQPTNMNLIAIDDYVFEQYWPNKYSTLIMEIDVEIFSPDNYTLEGILTDSYGNVVSISKTEYNLDLGPQTAFLLFSGTDIRNSGIDGPYTLASLTIKNWDDLPIIKDYDIHITDYYNHEDFTISYANVINTHESGNDTNANGFYEYLDADIEVIVPGSDDYKFTASLFNQSGDFIDSFSTDWIWLNSNTPTNISFKFKGNKIFSSGSDGPYIIGGFIVENVFAHFSGIERPYLNRVTLTSPYDFTEFEHILYGKVAINNRNYNSSLINVSVKNLQNSVVTSQITLASFEGEFTANIGGGLHDVWVKPKYYLATRNNSINVGNEPIFINFGGFDGGDINNDNYVDFNDLPLFSAEFGGDPCPYIFEICWGDDFNGDNTVDFSDLPIFSYYFGGSGDPELS